LDNIGKNYFNFFNHHFQLLSNMILSLAYKKNWTCQLEKRPISTNLFFTVTDEDSIIEVEMLVNRKYTSCTIHKGGQSFHPSLLRTNISGGSIQAFSTFDFNIMYCLHFLICVF